ncbi:MAG: hypothetical protein Q9201_001618 [Fulgogasparrea decipioides]
MTATTALTAQNTLGVSDIHHVPSNFVSKQIDACFDDIGVDVVKIVQVMVATSGAQLLPNEAVTNLREQLLPLTTILTPNIPEARLLLKNDGVETPEIKSVDDIVDMAESLVQCGPDYVLIKGGHLPFDRNYTVSHDPNERRFVIDVLLRRGSTSNVMLYKSVYSTSKNTHGTGCSLACTYSRPAACLIDWSSTVTAAIASNLALGHEMPQAVEKACRYVEAGIMTSRDLGRGSGPINHFHSLAVVGEEQGFQTTVRMERWDE